MSELSFEFFPPKSPDAADKLRKVRERLSRFDPGFFSVTYGAGGSTRDGTMQTVLDIQASGCDAAPHISFGTDSEERIRELLDRYRDAGIRRVVALRGDVPSGTGSGGSMRYAEELVTFIRRHFADQFHIEVAAYPEVHPESTSVASDIEYFKRKVDAGADSAITQYFYNAEAYFRYVENVRAADVEVPVVPGIMPITNYAGLVRFSDGCGADIPRWIKRQLESCGDDTERLKAFGEEVVTSLCERLLAGGAPGIHFYTMNQSVAVSRILRNLGR